MSRGTHVAVVGIIGSAIGLEPVSGGAEAPLLAPFRPGRSWAEAKVLAGEHWYEAGFSPPSRHCIMRRIQPMA